MTTLAVPSPTLDPAAATVPPAGTATIPTAARRAGDHIPRPGEGPAWFLACVVCGLDHGSVAHPSPRRAIEATRGWACPQCGGTDAWPVAGGM